MNPRAGQAITRPAISNNVEHGTRTGYTYWDCRGACCREANARYHRERRHLAVAPSGSHGKRSTYNNYNCRCDLCTAANHAYRVAV